MAQNNTIQYNVTAKDQASAVFSAVAKSAQGFGSSVSKAFENTAEATQKMQSAISKIKDVTSSGLGVIGGDFTKLGSLMGALPGPIGVVGQAIGDTMGRIVDSTIKASEGFRKMREKTGASVEFLSRFKEAADDVFVSAESVNSALTIFSKKIGGVEDPLDGSGQSAGAFAAKLKEIGVTSDNLEEALFQVADRFKEMPNGTDKAALAVQLFGKQGAELIPILNKGRDGIKAMGDAADALGLTFDTKTSAATKRLMERQDAFNDNIKGLETRLGKELIPTFLDWSDAQAQAAKETGGMLGPIRDLKALYLQLNSATYQAQIAQELENKTVGAGSDAFNEIRGRMSAGESVAKDYAEQMLRTQARQATFNKELSVTNTAMHEFPEWALGVEGGAQKVEAAMAPAAATTYDMAFALAKVNDNAGQTPKALDALAKAEAIYRIAINPAGAMTGEKSAREKAKDEFILAEAYKAVNQAILDYAAGTRGLTKAQADQQIADINAQTKGYKPGKNGQPAVGMSPAAAKKAIEEVTAAAAGFQVQSGITAEEGAKMFVGLKTGTLDAQTVIDNLAKNGSADLRDIKREADEVVRGLQAITATPARVTLHSRWDDYEATLDKIDRLNKTVTVTVNTNYTVAGTNVEADQGGNTRAKGGPVKKARPYLVGEQGPEMFVPYTSGYIVPNNAPYTDPGTKVAQSFNVNNPSVIINSVNGAAIAQQIARGNRNVVNRARTKASFMG